ncbi:chain length determinant protein EpsF [Chitinimonas arctica]|uniref:Chain length determinant protein EpsF n=1 Tax=Chitinimonas arctica TaxID=2594795 RepID=A0A516SF63_9NEIS|nr:chain length determinant protein EpsF [Chitinimonas arctica]QDQ26668.1 chain length determinant protein EpsF [Chitinimonas arctica]
MSFQQFLFILRARSHVALLTLFLTVGTTLVVSLLLPKQYQASTAVVLDVKSPDPVAGMVLPGLAAPGYMATQIDIINSERVAQRVVKLLRMEESAAIKEQWREATEGKGTLRVWLAELLQKNLDVKPSRESNVINISFSASDPAFAASVANAFAQAYIDVNLELKVEPAKQYAGWFEEQTKALRDKLEQAQRNLSSYQQKFGIVATDERLDYETAKLNEIASQLTAVQGQTTATQSKRSTGEGSNTLIDVMQSPLINSLKGDIARLEAKLQESNINLGKNHPQTQRAESELASLRDKLASETRLISSSIGTSYQVSKLNEKSLIEAIDVQKKRVLELNKQRDELNVLRRDVESAQRAFEAVSGRSAQTRLESLSIQTNIVVLNVAAEPVDPSRPKVVLNVLVAIFLGGFLGIGFVMMFELANRRIRSGEDLAQAIDLPVLAEIVRAEPLVRGRKGWRSLLSRKKPRRQSRTHLAAKPARLK